MSGLQVNFLGSGDAFCASGRHQASYLLQSGQSTLLLDCGVTALASLKRSSIRADSIDAVLVSHLHGDHFAGIPFLLLEYTCCEPRSRPLLIVGPPETAERVHELYRAMYRDVGSDPLPFPLEFVELRPGSKARAGEAEVLPFEVPHQKNGVSLGYRIRLGGRRVVYTGDTGWTEDLLRQSEDSDLLISECCFFETRVPFHLDYPRLHENRHRFGTQRMVLSHLGREVLARQGEVEIELALDGLTAAV
jgi:ribonuclease BN (tRNA processing enzyme)